MIAEDIDFEIERIVSKIVSTNAKRVLLQFPEGLLPYACKVVSLLEEQTNVEAIISLDPCWGACDLADYEASALKVDLLVHFGHASWPLQTRVPVLFVECFSSRKIVEQAVNVALQFKLKELILTSTVQHVKELAHIKNALENIGVKAFLLSKSKKAPYPGQVLGCDFSNASLPNINTVLFIGGGLFHPVGLALFTGKRVISLDPYTGEVCDPSSYVKRLLLERYAHISRAKEAKKFGVVIGLKRGQMHVDTAEKVKRLLRSSGKEAYLLAMREIVPERFLNLKGAEALVITACPRIAIEDASRFSLPILTLNEVEIVVGRKKWSEVYPLSIKNGEEKDG